MKMPLVAMIGRSNTGKTTVIEKLIPLLAAKGIRVGTIKHHAHDFEMDREGKDTYRHKKAGARIAMIASPKKIGLVEDLERELTIDELLARHVRDVDLVIIEGFKKEDMPKIEVYNYRRSEPPVATGDKNLIAIISDRPIEAAVPIFLRDNIEEIAAFIIEKFGLGRR